MLKLPPKLPPYRAKPHYKGVFAERKGFFNMYPYAPKYYIKPLKMGKTQLTVYLYVDKICT